MQISLNAGEIICLEGGSNGVTVHCVSGLLWLTTGNGCDYFVDAGRPFHLDSGSNAVVEAFQATRLYTEQAEKQRISFTVTTAGLQAGRARC